MQVTQLEQVYLLKRGSETIKLKAPNPDWEPEQVRTMYMDTYPELNTCTISGPEIKNDKYVYEFVSVIGTKG